MPIYEYQCEKCQQQFDVLQKITDDPLTLCEACGGELRKLVSSTSFILKGGGWYATDYGNRSSKSEAKTKAASPAKSEKQESKSEKKAQAA